MSSYDLSYNDNGLSYAAYQRQKGRKRKALRRPIDDDDDFDDSDNDFDDFDDDDLDDDGNINNNFNADNGGLFHFDEFHRNWSDRLNASSRSSATSSSSSAAATSSSSSSSSSAAAAVEISSSSSSAAAASRSPASSSSSTLFKLTCYLGDPRRDIPSHFKSMKKGDIIEWLCNYRGFERNELVGTKEAMLTKAFKELPSAQFYIDSRECIQRVLVVFLDQIQYDDTHLFEVKLPMRTVSGSAMSAIDPGLGKSNGSIALSNCNLHQNDWCKFTYDFGNSITITMHVDAIETVDRILPEKPFIGYHPTRADIINTKHLNRIPHQYH